MMNVIYFKSASRVCMARRVLSSVVNVSMKCHVITSMELVSVFVYLVGRVINVTKVSQSLHNTRILFLFGSFF